jgi:O-antigen/teichoic acid export membrane protein
MSQASPQTGKHILNGTAQIFLAEALLFPTGLITAAYLTRQLGPEGYGLLTLTAIIIAWVEWGSSSVFYRTTIKFISEAEDWKVVGTTVLQQHLLVGTGATIALCLLAVPIAQLMKEPALVTYIWLFAPQVLFFNLARAHRTMLTGLGQFSQQAIAGASRWIARLILIILLVHLGFSVTGAILGNVGATAVELLVSRIFVRPPLFYHTAFPLKQLWNYAIPLSVYSLSMRLFDKLDLLMLKALGGTVQQAGVYGAAQNLALIPGVFSQSFAPVLLATLGRVRRNEGVDRAKRTGQQAMRLVLLLLPFAALTSGSATEITALVFGAQFAATAPLLSVLIVGAIAQVMISVTTSILTAADQPKWVVTLTAPLIPIVILAHWLIIPQFGALGAALSTTLAATLGAIATMLAVYRTWQILPPYQTLLRSLLVCGFAYAVAFYWSTPGIWLLLKLSLVTLLIPVAFFVLGEFIPGEVALIRSLMQRSTAK